MPPIHTFRTGPHGTNGHECIRVFSGTPPEERAVVVFKNNFLLFIGNGDHPCCDNRARSVGLTEYEKRMRALGYTHIYTRVLPDRGPGDYPLEFYEQHGYADTRRWWQKLWSARGSMHFDWEKRIVDEGDCKVLY